MFSDGTRTTQKVVTVPVGPTSTSSSRRDAAARTAAARQGCRPWCTRGSADRSMRPLLHVAQEARCRDAGCEVVVEPGRRNVIALMVWLVVAHRSLPPASKHARSRIEPVGLGGPARDLTRMPGRHLRLRRPRRPRGASRYPRRRAGSTRMRTVGRAGGFAVGSVTQLQTVTVPAGPTVDDLVARPRPLPGRTPSGARAPGRSRSPAPDELVRSCAAR